MKDSVTRATISECSQVAQLIAEAFHALDVAKWLVPDADERARVLPRNFAIVAEHALRHGSVYWSAERDAVAVWFPHDGEPLPEIEDYDQRLLAACGEATPRFQVLDGHFDKAHPHEPHHYAAMLAVSPSRQGRGLGGSLLSHHLDQLDRTGTPAYLEAACARSRELYLRLGFKDLEPFTLPDGPTMYPMWRPAQG
ncbi:GNAT family N-acetyltransferase [Natronoglycomyces albus]|uniref:GNAT family N-acetyltransferase n=1 Tax=Natronoglycomyces albus TaxID=2811108 RepID=A0A895XNC2_9ACTN|nr:GNAT family N-acetyltransferase [Natronoglycomyces albus]QSB06854.1 GNAT family N-acetyltransferase [Natronoglycomyces albus]